ncbi:hypothetical protein Bra3105_00905 [Brachybacterium halotolerans subsp. kimchii]|uniref:hypothetical protein n=1 Tax=Brachybacterium halotolerans TaxID=2795215 RepID=UPI001E2ED690|nr:hypothetical protein [Brachybacterium halotolerans]UEJ82925.1 hypothetical protein Bra3105_00905 [Brachybacterium halotolerans subsp. kimchii]
MPTLTMQQIADAAQVRRPVVTTWRRRYADTDHPFPAALDDGTGRFDADAIATWLRATGAGNNPEAADELAAHSSQTLGLSDDVEASSALLLLHSLIGEPLTGADPMEIGLRIAESGAGSLLDLDETLDLLEDAERVRTVDSVAEAAFSAMPVLDRMVAGFESPGGPWAAQSLTHAGADLIAAVIDELRTIAPRTLVPFGTGGHVLANLALRGLDEGENPSFAIDPSTQRTPADRAAWRRLLAHGIDCEHLESPSGESSDRTADTGDLDPGEHALVLAQWQQVEDPAAFFDAVDRMVLGLGPTNIALVLGPASLLVEDGLPVSLAEHRARILDAPGPDAPRLRYLARLPKGLSRFGGRRRLALWVLGRAQSLRGTDWTVFGNHGSTPLTAATSRAIASDVAVALTGGSALHEHPFLSSARRASGPYLAGTSLLIDTATGSAPDPGALLATVWDLSRGALDGAVSVAIREEPAPGDRPRRAPGAADTADPIDWRTATRSLARDLAGVRIDEELIGGPGHGSVVLIGPEEVREPGRIGRRAVDRLDLERTCPRARFTEPGDVVFVSSGGAAALVDDEGGHLVRAPARVLRCRRADGVRARVLHPRIAARDIARAVGTDRRAWHLHTLPADQLDGTHAAARAVSARRDSLLAALRDLDDLEDTLYEGVVTDALTLTTAEPASAEPAPTKEI